MSHLAAETAKKHLLAFEVPKDASSDAPAQRQDKTTTALTSELIKLIATYMRAMDKDDAVGKEIRLRGGLIAKETGPGSKYDNARQQFLRLFSDEDDLPDPSPTAEFGVLQDERNSFVFFEQSIAITKSQSAVYRGLVHQLKATRDFENEPKDIPGFGNYKGEKRKRGVMPPPSPSVVIDTWVAELHRVAQTVDARHLWGRHLMVLCEEALYTDSGRESLAWLSVRLEKQLNSAMRAIQNAAASLATGAGGLGPTEAEQLGLATHSDDYRSVKWYGADYTFTPKQAKCIKALWKAWKSNTHVSKDDLIRACDSSGTEVKDIFKE